MFQAKLSSRRLKSDDPNPPIGFEDFTNHGRPPCLITMIIPNNTTHATFMTKNDQF